MKLIGIVIRFALVVFAIFCMADGSSLDAIAVLLLVIVLQLARLPHHSQDERRAYTGIANPLMRP